MPAHSADVEAALERFRTGDRAELYKLADSGSAEAQAYAGAILSAAPRNEAEAARGCRYLDSASRSRADAMHFLGEAYQLGRCGPIDLQKAAATFKAAGDMGFAKSRCAEGNVWIELGQSSRGAALCRQAAELGDPDAQTDYANFLLIGEHVAKDVDAARRWYEKAADVGHVNASYVLGQIYWNGDGVPRDTARAAQLWLVAYRGGRADAAKLLGDEAFRRSRRGENDWDPAVLDEAAGWYEKAAAEGAESQRAESVERRDLARDLAAAMRRRLKH